MGTRPGPDSLTTAARLDEVAAILALGLLRLMTKTGAESALDRGEVSSGLQAKTERVSVTANPGGEQDDR